MEQYKCSLADGCVRFPRQPRFYAQRETLRSDEDVEIFVDLAHVVGTMIDACDAVGLPLTVTIESHLPFTASINAFQARNAVLLTKKRAKYVAKFLESLSLRHRRPQPSEQGLGSGSPQRSSLIRDDVMVRSPLRAWNAKRECYTSHHDAAG